jgi:hypothetical protein
MSEQHASGPLVRHEQVRIAESSLWAKLPMIGGVLAVIGLGIGFATMGKDPAKFWTSYLTAVFVFMSLGLGGLFFTLVSHATRAQWSIVVRRIAECFMITLPFTGALLLPLLFLGMHDLYHWTHHEVVEADPMLSAKAPYLNEGFFRNRTLVYIGVWALLALSFWRWSTRQDDAKDPAPYSHKMRWWAPLGIISFALTLTFGAFDFMMSLDPHWFSTIFGVYYFAGCVVTTHGALALVILLLQRSGYLRGVVTAEHYHDLGKMMFAFTVFWGYIGFSQYFLIWYASIPEETHWFSYRGHGDWLTLSLTLVFMRFVLPFIGIMSRKIKRNPSTLMFWAVWVIVAELVDMFWLIQPPLAEQRGILEIRPDLFDAATLVGVGGVFLAVLGWGLNRAALVPMKDPRLEESLNHENF